MIGASQTMFSTFEVEVTKLVGDPLLARQIVDKQTEMLVQHAKENLAELQAAGQEIAKDLDTAGYGMDALDMANDVRERIRRTGLLCAPITLGGMLLGCLLMLELEDGVAQQFLLAGVSQALLEARGEWDLPALDENLAKD